MSDREHHSNDSDFGALKEMSDKTLRQILTAYDSWTGYYLASLYSEGTPEAGAEARDYLERTKGLRGAAHDIGFTLRYEAMLEGGKRPGIYPAETSGAAEQTEKREPAQKKIDLYRVMDELGLKDPGIREYVSKRIAAGALSGRADIKAVHYGFVFFESEYGKVKEGVLALAGEYHSSKGSAAPANTEKGEGKVHRAASDAVKRSKISKNCFSYMLLGMKVYSDTGLKDYLWECAASDRVLSRVLMRNNNGLAFDEKDRETVRQRLKELRKEYKSRLDKPKAQGSFAPHTGQREKKIG